MYALVNTNLTKPILQGDLAASCIKQENKKNMCYMQTSLSSCQQSKTRPDR